MKYQSSLLIQVKTKPNVLVTEVFHLQLTSVGSKQSLNYKGFQPCKL